MSNTNPSSPPQFTALAERCEQAAGPDEHLERDIACELYGVFYDGIPMNVPTQPGYIFPRYTASLDAAMTLVPEGFDWIIGSTNGGLTIHAEVGGRGDEFMWFGSTPALALCAAALRAKDKS